MARGNIVPGNSGWRIEGWVNVPTASTDNTIFHIGSVFMMVHAYDLRGNNGDLISAGAFVPRLNHFSYSQLGPNGAVIHVDGVPYSIGPGGSSDTDTISFRSFPTGFLTGKDIVLSQVAIFARPHLNQPIAVPTAAYAGIEDGLLHLWRLDGSMDGTAAR